MSELFVCTTCFALTSAGTGMQRCRCEGYQAYEGVDCPSGYHLCYLCASKVAGGTSRWSWEVCNVCLKFNKHMQEKESFSLPVGRHSVMNGLAIPMSVRGPELDALVESVWQALGIAQTLEDWGLLQARELFESVASWRMESRIPVAKWEAKFALTGSRATSRSAAAFKGYLGAPE